MSRLARRVASLLLVLAVLPLLPAKADAQLGALKRRAQQAAREAMEDQLPFTPQPAPEFNDRVLEITGARLEGLLRGFEAEAAFARSAGKEYEDQIKAYEQAVKDHEKALERHGKDSEKWEVCAEEFRRKEEAASAANQARIDKAIEEMDEEEFEKYVEDLALRGEKLAKDLQAGKNDPATQRAWEEYQREVQILTVEQQRRAMLAMSGAMAESRRARTEDPRLVEACGARPEEPTAPVSPANGPESVLAQRGAEAAGMTPDQYAVMRERVLYWWEQDRRPAKMGFTQEEIDLLAGKADAVDEAFERMKKARVPL